MRSVQERQLTSQQLEGLNSGSFASSFVINPYYLTDPIWSKGRRSYGSNSVGRIGIEPNPSP